ncbi:MAG: hypothetical protein M0Z43_04305 [Acidithiobacillus sp.]|nr:hypothetical protein [Acidithiobacillus sp.]
MESVLQYVQFSATDLLARYQKKVDACSHLGDVERHEFLRQFADGLHGYTYLE